MKNKLLIHMLFLYKQMKIFKKRKEKIKPLTPAKLLLKQSSIIEF
jgi:hypothetical protein